MSCHDRQQFLKQISTEFSKQNNYHVKNSVISVNQIDQAQRIIAEAKNANEAEQNKIIEKIIQLLYFYSSHESQCDILQQLIYKRKNLILIARTSFEKSMILQTAFILMIKSITMIILLLSQIEQEQTKYITCIDDRFCLLNVKIISTKILKNIQHEKYIYILINSELVINNKFCKITTNLIFKK